MEKAVNGLAYAAPPTLSLYFPPVCLCWSHACALPSRSLRLFIRPDASAARGCVATERDEFAGKLGVPAIGEDRPLPACLLQRLALCYQQAHRHQASLQERVGAPAAAGTEERGSREGC